MATPITPVAKIPPAIELNISKLRSQYGCGSIELTGTDSGLYERHLMFDNIVDLPIADSRERVGADFLNDRIRVLHHC
jgi:hypothetical protein